jgi:hypothetical protein
MISRFFHIILLLTILSFPVLAADIALESRVDRDRITIGDPVTYTLSFTHPPSITVQQPPRVAELGPWTVRDARLAREQKRPGTTRLTYTLVTFSTGTVLIPEIAFQYTDGKGAAGEIRSSSTPVTVESVLARLGDAGDIRDIKPPLALKTPLIVYILWLLGLILTGGAACFWYMQYRKKQPALNVQPAMPTVLPYQAALQALEALKQSGLVAEGRTKEFYSALNDIIRDYLAAVYSFETRDRTTAELFQELRRLEPDKKTLAALRDFFEACDLVKFARYRPEDAV